jgi:phage shock protein A
MTELTLVSNRKLPLRPLIETALANEVRLLEVGIRRTERRLAAFETAHGMTTAEFVRRFEDDELDETFERAEWVGEYRLLQRLNEKAEALRGVRFAN